MGLLNFHMHLAPSFLSTGLHLHCPFISSLSVIIPSHPRTFVHAFLATRKALSLTFCLFNAQFNGHFLPEAFPELFGKSNFPVTGALKPHAFLFYFTNTVVVSHMLIKFDKCPSQPLNCHLPESSSCSVFFSQLSLHPPGWAQPLIHGWGSVKFAKWKNSVRW